MNDYRCRINLSKTNYKEIPYKLLCSNSYKQAVDIYHQYCDYRQFHPHHYHPLWIEDFESAHIDIIGYYDQDRLVAFSIVYLYPSEKSCMADQFAWNYETPSLKLGYKSIRSECARYKRLGYQYYYLGEICEYKQQLQGFELVQRPQSKIL